MIGGFLDLLKRIFSAIGSFLNNLFSSELGIKDNCHEIIVNVQDLKKNIEKQVTQLKEHKFDPRWRTRVISPLRAIKHFVGIFEFISKDWKTRIEKVEQPIKDLLGLLKLEKDIVGAGNEDVSGVVKAFNKTEASIHAVAVMIEDVLKAVKEIKQVDDVFQQIIDDILKLEGLFLPQKNKCEYVGVKFKFRQRVSKKRPGPPKPPVFEADPRGTEAKIAQMRFTIEEQRVEIDDLKRQL